MYYAGPSRRRWDRQLPKSKDTWHPPKLRAFNVGSQEALLDAVHQVTSVTLLLGIIAGMGPLVGGMDTNTLLTSVAERTREIGIRVSAPQS